MSIQNLQRQLNHSEPKTRQDALTQILNLGNHEAYGLLMFTATNHFSPDTRREAKKFSLLLQKRLFSQVSTPQDSDLSPEEEKAFEDFKGADATGVRKALQILLSADNPKIFQRYTKELHQNQRPEILPYLILGLARLGKEEAIPYLVNYLRSNNETIRASVIRALVDISAPQNLSILVRFSRDPSNLVRQEALSGLSRTNPQILLSTLKEVLSGKGEFHKEAVLYVIARLNFEPGIELVRALSNDAHEQTRERAKRVLEHFQTGSKPSEPAPADKASEEEPKEVSPEEEDLVIPVQDKQIEPDESDPPDSESDLQEENCLRAVRQGEESSAIKSIFTLIEISRLGRLGEVQESVQERGSKKVLATYLMAIAQSHDKGFRDFLIECLEHDDPRVQANAIEALRMVGCADVKQKILPFVNSRNDRTRGNAIVFLHSTGLIDTEQELSTMLQSRSDNRKLSAIFALAELFDPLLIEILEIPMDSPNSRVTKRAMDVLRMFVLEDNPKAVAIAKKWNIYDEMTADSVELSEESDLEEESLEGDLEAVAAGLEELANEINQSSAAPKTPPSPTKDSQSTGALGKFKSFMEGLIKKKDKD
ncbi:HEAT repeat domain-containing protein [bacterium]|nr:HEAT repeat domain-containing protein [bacterium]